MHSTASKLYKQKHLFTDLDSAEQLYDRRVARILTSDLPQYFAVITRVRQESHFVGADGLVISSTIAPQVQAVFPPGALTKNIPVGLQVWIAHYMLIVCFYCIARYYIILLYNVFFFIALYWFALNCVVF